MQCGKVKTVDIVVPNVFQAIHLDGILRSEKKRTLTQTHSIASHKSVWMDFD